MTRLSDRVAEFWPLPLNSTPEPASKPAEFREASAGYTVDPDEHEWRRLSGDPDRDLLPVTQERMQEIAVHLWESDLLANRLIELPVAYLLAKGVSLRVDDDKLQQVIDQHWKDGLNQWDIKLQKKLRELSLFGEQCWPVFVNMAGRVRVAYLDPGRIATVVTDPDNIEQPIGIVTKTDRKGKAKRYRVICNVPELDFGKRTQEIRATFTDGDCFYFRINDLSASTRGRSDLLAAADWLDAYDQFLYGELDRTQFLRAFTWDVSIKGASPEEVKARAREIAPPRPGSVRVHNDAETWTAQSPDLKTYEAAAGAKLFRNHVLGGATLPPTWYADGEDANRANGSAMAEPTEKMLEMRQRFVGYMLRTVGVFVARAWWSRIGQVLTPEQEKIVDTIRVEWPEMVAKDTTKYAAAFQNAVAGALAAMTAQLLTRETALRILAVVANNLGLDIDVDAELEALEKARQEQELRDSMNNDLPAGTDEGADPDGTQGADAGATS